MATFVDGRHGTRFTVRYSTLCVAGYDFHAPREGVSAKEIAEVIKAFVISKDESVNWVGYVVSDGRDRIIHTSIFVQTSATVYASRLREHIIETARENDHPHIEILVGPQCVLPLNWFASLDDIPKEQQLGEFRVGGMQKRKFGEVEAKELEEQYPTIGRTVSISAAVALKDLYDEQRREIEQRTGHSFEMASEDPVAKCGKTRARMAARHAKKMRDAAVQFSTSS